MIFEKAIIKIMQNSVKIRLTLLRQIIGTTCNQLRKTIKQIRKKNSEKGSDKSNLSKKSNQSIKATLIYLEHM